MMLYSQPGINLTRSLTYLQALPAQRNSSARTMRWECASAELLIAGFVVSEEPARSADDGEHQSSSEC